MTSTSTFIAGPVQLFVHMPHRPRAQRHPTFAKVQLAWTSGEIWKRRTPSCSAARMEEREGYGWDDHAEEGMSTSTTTSTQAVIALVRVRELSAYGFSLAFHVLTGAYARRERPHLPLPSHVTEAAQKVVRLPSFGASTSTSRPCLHSMDEPGRECESGYELQRAGRSRGGSWGDARPMDVRVYGLR
ncbi:hypothetical protein K438DRAFT_1959081 [Mycena galopus ATCC 62051]|nr:hypothetical protein K438DRAFT_1959081 [Mycena galopus ATCC 62051]